VFGPQFFPKSDPSVATLLSFVIFGSAFLTRPIGGLVFGHIGDRMGRKPAFIATLLLAGLSTVFIGLMPTYDAIGIWAPVLLTLMRLVQGIAHGGEWGGAVLMAVEYAPNNRKGLFGSLPQTGVYIGGFLATAVFALFKLMPAEAFQDWGWRIPFLLAFPILFLGAYIRSGIKETPVFEETEKDSEPVKLPLIEALRTSWGNILRAIGMRIAENINIYFFTVFAINYAAKNVKISDGSVLTGLLIAFLVGAIFCPIAGALSDRVGRRPVYGFGAAFLAIMAFPFFWLVNTGQGPLLWLGLALAFGIGHSAMFGPQAAFLSEMFKPRVRYSGMSIAYQFSGLIAGGPAPTISAALLSVYGGASWPLSVYLLIVGLISFVSVFLTPETWATKANVQRNQAM
jgi:MFS family permease